MGRQAQPFRKGRQLSSLADAFGAQDVCTEYKI
jgi:hypothetical protein